MQRQLSLKKVLPIVTILAIGQGSILRAVNPVISQKNFTEPWRLFEKKHYNNAQYLFQEETERCMKSCLHNLDSIYYDAIASIKLGRLYGEQQLLDFAYRYPQTRKASLAQYVLGNMSLQNQDFEKAIQYYKTVDVSILDPTSADQMKYNLAYSYLSIKDLPKSLEIFIDLANSDSVHKIDANYYVGFITFKDGRYPESLEFLKKAAESELYKPVVPYLIAQSYYRQKKFDTLIVYIDDIKSSGLDFKNKAEIDLLAAEGYFFTEKYGTALTIYNQYLQIEKAPPEPVTLYRIGYCFLMVGRHAEALEYFSKLTFEDSLVGQLSWYYSGDIFLRNGELDKAIAAFQVAASQDFDKDVTEKAALAFAKVNLSMKDYDAAINGFLEFKKRYPKSKNLYEVDQLLGLAYISTNNYDLAISHIESLPIKSPDVAKVYQKITFLRSKQLFNIGDYNAAMDTVNKSLKYDGDRLLTDYTKLLKADIFAIKSQHTLAIDQYRDILQSSTPDPFLTQMATYGLGYAYFNTQDYKRAYECFSKLTKAAAITQDYINDVKLRLADSSYAIKDYDKALTLYEEASVYNTPHCIYYKGMIYKNLSMTPKAREHFSQILSKYPDSIYYEKSMYEIAITYLIDGDYDSAAKRFSDFIKNNANTAMVPSALLSRAVALSNIGKHAEAVEDYARILENHPHHPCAESALLGMQQSLLATGKLDDFPKYIDDYKSKYGSDETVEKATFISCRSIFYDQKYELAVTKLTDFIINNPNSVLIPDAHYLLAEAEFILGNYREAVVHYEFLLSDEGSADFSKILLRLASIYQALNQYDKALVFFSKLKTHAKSDKDRNLGLEGAIKAAFVLKEYDLLKRDAALYLSQPNLLAKSVDEVNLILAKVALDEKNPQEALPLLKKVINGKVSAQAAEAQYTIALLLYQAGKYRDSLKALFELNTSYPQHKSWIDRSFLLIADNYIANNDLLQAKATLQAIVERCPDKQIVDEAQQKLTKVEVVLSKNVRKSKPSFKSTGEFKTI